jgi:ADP-glucose pyrophosphorylase
MQFERANWLNNTSSEEQKRSCNHSYDKEYFLGAATDDYVCIKCGDTITRFEYKEWLNRSKEEGEEKNEE